MTVKHVLAAVLVAALWGTNFVAIKISFQAFGPFTQLTLRFALASLPFILFIKKPNCSWKLIGQFALYNWMLQLSLISLALHYGLPAGLSSLLMQTQNIFTVLLAYLYFGYHPKRGEIIGLSISFLGVLLIGLKVGASSHWMPFIMVLFAALSVSRCNLIFKNQKESIAIVPLVVWSCLLPILPMMAFAVGFEGVNNIVASFKIANIQTVGAILYTVLFSTLLGYSIFAFLLKTYEPAQVVPFTLLVPVFTIGTSYFVTGELISWLDVAAGTFIIGGLVINQIHRRSLGRKNKLVSTALKQAA